MSPTQELARRPPPSSTQRALLEKRLRAGPSAASESQAIPRRPDQRQAPLSFAQQRLWFLDKLVPGSPNYNIARVWHLTGPLDVAALEQSLSEIIRRHQALRTRFVAVDGQPAQIIADAKDSALPRVDLDALPPRERAAEAQRLAAEEARWPFDLACGPLIRHTLLRLDDQAHALLLTIHHIVFDGWSAGVFFGELATLYQVFSRGQTCSLPELPIQYADWAVWQRHWLQGDALVSQLAFWKKRLENFPDVLELPTDRPRSPAQTDRGSIRSFTLSHSLSRQLKMLGQRAKATPFMTLLAAFKALLYRYTGQQDILVGTPVANRNRPETEGLIGLFANTLVLRTDLSGNPTFRKLLDQVRQTVLEAFDHQDVPFEKLVEELQPQRDQSHQPLFQAMFVFQHAPARPVELVGLSSSLAATYSETTHFDLTLSLEETEQGSGGTLEYNTDLFDDATIARMAGHFQILLEGIAADPDRPLAELPLLTKTELDQLLVEWNDTVPKGDARTDHLRAGCIHHLFEAQAAKTPDAIAIVHPGMDDHAVSSFGELNQRANQLAHRLRALKVGPESLVGICLERSPTALAAILGILKAGGAYVPLDPALPQERLALMLQDAGARVLITQRQLMDRFSEYAAQVICLDSEWQAIAQADTKNPSGGACAENLAYTIYTSGSTGRPKGVQIPHRALVNHSLAIANRYELQSSDRVLQFASLSFDIATEELFPSWSSGAAVVLRSEREAASLSDFLRFVQQERLTVLNLPTAYWHEWALELADAQAQPPACIRLLIVGSEQALPERLALWQRSVGQRIGWRNAYGPTEATITATIYKPAVAKAIRAGPSVPVGRPITNTCIYLLGDRLQPVPIGVSGELCIGGTGLARGYLNRPDQTAEKFIPNPFILPRAEGDTRIGTRLYKTGDLARYLPDGNIEFLGRLDYQIKLRGFRIEPGEIEAALARHPRVREALVLARKDTMSEQGRPATDRGPQLIAYVVSDREPAPASQDLRSFLKEKLPDYMVPAVYATLDALPRTPGGKVDRRALPVPGRPRPEMEKAWVAPRNPIEEILASIWARVLGLDQVGAHDDFFELGGHSLLAVQIISRVREAFQVELPLRCIFETPSLAGLAQSIAATRRSQQLQIPRLRPVSQDKNLALSFAQQRLWFLSQLEPDSPNYNIPAAFCLTGALNVQMLEQSLSAILQRHQALRTEFAVVESRPVQIILPAHAQAVTAPLSKIDLQEIPQAQREAAALRLATAEGRRPFDLSHGPLMRAILFLLGERKHILLLNLHHIVSDEWSHGVFMQELAALYTALCSGLPSPLPELPIQYGDFAAWQQEWLQSDTLETLLAYWRQQLDGAPATLELPTDHPRPAARAQTGQTLSFALSPGLTQAFQTLSRQEGVTLFMALLAAFDTLLYHYTGQTDIVIGTPVANRNHAEVEKLIGFFVNTLVLRADLAGNPSFRELLKRVRKVALEAYTYQDLPFERLVEELHPERSLSHTPLFQVLFAFQKEPVEALELPGLESANLRIESGTSKFDLALIMAEIGPELVGSVEYDTQLFDRTTIARMIGHWQTLLEGIAARPETRVADLPLLTEAERRQLLFEWNDTGAERPQDQCIHKLFEARAERTPDAITLVFQDLQLTCRELNRRSNQLAHYLQALGVGPETLVGLCMERSAKMLVGLLGILKAGGAYVSLDPTYPPERLNWMLVDADARVLLTQVHLKKYFASIPRPLSSKVVCLDSDWELVAQACPENPASQVGGENLAYVIYTSGSTGKPKGVLVPHRGLANVSEAQVQAFDIKAQDRVLQWATLSFDASIFEMVMALGGRATLCLGTRENLLPGPDLIRLLQDLNVTIITLTPSALASLPAEPLAALRIINVAGQVCPTELVARWALGRRFFNLYGPTEATIWTTTAECADSLQKPPIGRAIANVQAYILNAHQQPAPVGVPGELGIGGIGLARGYLNRPDLTAEKFIPHPFPQAWGGVGGGTRLYKTGDLVRYLPDGNIEFLGRIDYQVKVRGYRIELGEVEAALAQHPAVREAVVIAWEKTETTWRAASEAGPGDKRLVAYLVTSADPKPAANELRRFLQEKLPDYMLPSTFVMLDALPLMPSGKVDRRALPAPESARTESEREFVPPRNPDEETVAGILAQVLGLERVSVHDDFFELGGHSLLATQVISQVRETFRVELPLRCLFEVPTVAGLAEAVARLEIEQADQETLIELLSELDQQPITSDETGPGARLK